MLYVKVTNGSVQFPYTIAQLRKDNPDSSLPANLTDQTLAEFNVFPVQSADQPNLDWLTETLSHANPQLIDGKWTEVWVVNKIPAETASLNVRAKRNRLLQESDWTQGKDISDGISSAWATYRNQLRDVPQQEGFPYSVQWPVAPNA